MVIVTVSYGYGYTRGSGWVRVAILRTGRVRVRVSTAATGTGRVAKMVDPHTSTLDFGVDTYKWTMEDWRCSLLSAQVGDSDGTDCFQFKV